MRRGSRREFLTTAAAIGGAAPGVAPHRARVRGELAAQAGGHRLRRPGHVDHRPLPEARGVRGPGRRRLLPGPRGRVRRQVRGRPGEAVHGPVGLQAAARERRRRRRDREPAVLPSRPGARTRSRPGSTCTSRSRSPWTCPAAAPWRRAAARPRRAGSASSWTSRPAPTPSTGKPSSARSTATSAASSAERRSTSAAPTWGDQAKWLAEKPGDPEVRLQGLGARSRPLRRRDHRAEHPRARRRGLGPRRRPAPGGRHRRTEGAHGRDVLGPLLGGVHVPGGRPRHVLLEAARRRVGRHRLPHVRHRRHARHPLLRRRVDPGPPALPRAGRCPTCTRTARSATSPPSTTASPSGDFSNPTVAASVRSNLTTILGRTAAWRQRAGLLGRDDERQRGAPARPRRPAELRAVTRIAASRRSSSRRRSSLPRPDRPTTLRPAPTSSSTRWACAWCGCRPAASRWAAFPARRCDRRRRSPSRHPAPGPSASPRRR